MSVDVNVATSALVSPPWSFFTASARLNIAPARSDLDALIGLIVSACASTEVMAPNNSIAARAYLDISYLSFGFLMAAT
ncbi:hypothetical protein [Burkholderia contaminans]|uniref:hypothetical protein n=1 Tax=Burkholderia contaminans TaxID=488447 RepID=UPI0020C61884|nr:hypothetical protein [Burkholderia contaminans]